MKKKNGFTLIELLAVIIILAVIALIATPIVLNVVEKAQERAEQASVAGYADAVKTTAYEYFMSNQAYPTTIDTSKVVNHGDKVYCENVLYSKDHGVVLNNCSVKEETNEKKYCFAEGKTYDDCNNQEFKNIYKESLTVEPKPVNNCTFEGELVAGKTYANGQYTYRYLEIPQYFDSRLDEWNYSSMDNGWSVIILNYYDSTPITTKLCTSINGELITAMKGTFHLNAATTLDLSSFDTSNVTDMSHMFNASQATALDLSNFDTSNVTNMSYMFNGSQATTLDLSNFDTSNVTDMNLMFNNSQATTLNLSSFDTSNVTDMSYMFNGSQATTLDLSSFDTSNVTNMDSMFEDCSATVGYARTQEDADRFNASSGKPDTLTFIVKP